LFAKLLHIPLIPPLRASDTDEILDVLHQWPLCGITLRLGSNVAVLLTLLFEYYRSQTLLGDMPVSRAQWNLTKFFFDHPSDTVCGKGAQIRASRPRASLV
jgi:hypothetical protein